MAILFMEGFDGFNTGTDAIEDHRFSFLSTSGISLSTGRSGSGKSLSSTNADFIAMLPQDSSDTVWIQFAYKVNYNITSDEEILAIRQDGSTIGSLWVNASGNLFYRRGYSTATLGTGTGSITTATWHYIELKVKFDNSTGTVDLKLDGITELALTSQDTNDLASALCDAVYFYKNDDLSGFSNLWDDIVIGDSSGTDSTDWLGDCSIELLTPDGAGNYTQFTPLSGSNYQNVDEAPATDDDTTYNSSSTAGHKDTFTCSNLTATAGSVYAVQVGYVAKREAGGGRLIRSMIRTSATDANGTGRYVPSYYGHRHDLFENDAGGSDWTISSVNAMEIGYNLET